MTDTTNNLALWDSVARVPPEHLKGFKRGGGFSGTAIKPMWAIKTMTEKFGPCGERWGMDAPEFTTHAANGEILVYCVLSVWVEKTDAKVYGVGGDKILSVNKYGPQTDDEAFKKAYTDALTNALKLLGVGADIHMGLWDGNKYVDETPDKPAPTKTATRSDFQQLCAEVHDQPSFEALEAWSNKNTARIDKLHPDLSAKIHETITAKQFCFDIASHETVETLEDWRTFNADKVKLLGDEAKDYVAKFYTDHKSKLTRKAA